MDARELYDADAGKWLRRSPNSLSDFTGRPAFFELCGRLEGLRVLDLGCGEGYCSRELAARGAQVTGVDLSAEMIEAARQQEASLDQGIDYRQGGVEALEFPAESFDLVTAVFVYNYVQLAEMQCSFREVHRVLKAGGHLAFAVPHPSLAFLREAKPPFFFDVGGSGYFSARDQRSEGEIHCVDGTVLRVQMVHKTFEDYFEALRRAGFTSLPRLHEHRVLKEHLALHPELFEPVADLPLHASLRIRKT